MRRWRSVLLSSPSARSSPFRSPSTSTSRSVAFRISEVGAAPARSTAMRLPTRSRALASRRLPPPAGACRSSQAASGSACDSRALAQGGEALVLDEPTTFLDVAHEMAAFELLHELTREGVAVMLVSHQLNLVARFADEIVLLHEGRVAAAGAPEDVMQAAILERVYEWPLVVTRDPAVGAPALLPLRVGRRA